MNGTSIKYGMKCDDGLKNIQKKKQKYTIKNTNDKY